MHQLPPEIHGEICKQILTCDDGSSIRALGASSRYFRRIAAPFYFHTIYLHQQHPTQLRLSKLVSILSLTPHDYHPIKHLHVTLTIHNHGPDATNLNLTRNPISNENQALSILDILRHSAPTGETIALFLPDVPLDSSGLLDVETQHFPGVMVKFLSIPFPHLRSLSIRGTFHIPDAITSKTKLGCFPHLTHLCIMDIWEPAALFLAVSTPLVFPNLTHFRVSGDFLHYWPVVIALHGVFRRADLRLVTTWDPPENAAELPASLKWLRIEYYPRDLAGAELRAFQIIRYAEELSRNSKSPLTFKIVERDPYSVEDMHKEWLQTMSGELGYWKGDSG